MGYTHYYYMTKEDVNDHWHGTLLNPDGSIPMMHRQVDIVISEFISRYNTYVRAHPDTLAKVEVMELHTSGIQPFVPLESGLIVPDKTRYTFIHFNGIGDNAHESFIFPPRREVEGYGQPEDKHHFEFTKTNYKPYDQCVTAFMLIAKEYLKDHIILKSDGGTDDWIKGNEMAGNYDVDTMTKILTLDFNREVEE